jgi:hypothetical protein
VELELDHIFIMCAPNGPEASSLSALGLLEGANNTHPGQGTACRRYFFRNAYLELLWVCDPVEAQSEVTRRTRLWERWSARRQSACPLGVVLRPAKDAIAAQPPFATWSYTPAYLPNDLAIEIAVDTPLTEPEFLFLRFGHAGGRVRKTAAQHAISLEDITNVRISTPAAGPRTEAGRWAEASGLVSFEAADQYVLALEFDGAVKGKHADLRPGLPLVLTW